MNRSQLSKLRRDSEGIALYFPHEVTDEEPSVSDWEQLMRGGTFYVPAEVARVLRDILVGLAQTGKVIRVRDRAAWAIADVLAMGEDRQAIIEPYTDKLHDEYGSVYWSQPEKDPMRGYNARVSKNGGAA